MQPSNPNDLFLSEIEMEIQNRKVAIGFAQWLQENRWYSFINGKWHYTFDQGTAMARKTYEKDYMKTTEELYNKYLESLKDKA